jgi:subfamily B ATP-binding cassette protein HlyB/CyaB
MSTDDVAQAFPGGDRFEHAEILRAARAFGLKARLTRPSIGRLATMPMPAIARESSGDYIVIGRVLPSVDGGSPRLMVLRPNRPPSIVMSIADLAQIWDGDLILVSRRTLSGDPNPVFGIGWFFDAVLRYRRILGEVLLVSLALQILGLATPLFFQVIIDKVLVHRSLETLNVIAAGLGAAILFDVLMTGLRSYIFSHTTSRVDVELGARLFQHLLRLPVGYFGVRRVGDTVARVRELENIRQFLTGSTLTLVLDTIFGIIFLAVIFAYSSILGLVVTFSIPFYVLISFLATPTIRARVQEKFRRGSENQSFLVETISGIETVKAMAVESHVQKRWEGQLSGYVRAAFRVSSLGVIASQSAQLVSRGTTLGILYVGAGLVMREKLTVGELIAVNMLAGQLSGPILRLAQIWQDFQQARVSIDRVGDILNATAEPTRPPGAAARPTIKGAITIENVTFRYHVDAPPALQRLSLSIPAGQIIGIVGPSGSGKSTLTKLVQRLRVPEAGRVLIDDLDLALIEPSWLRKNVGVVLQESFLFTGTIRDNIALSNPDMPMNHIAGAAQLAGAHSFITELPGGYDTEVGERGASLSGGQRQRIAIARALAGNPRILIFDEATSSLDLESEQAIQQNMQRICQGRTVLIVAHRLSAVRYAHRIVTVERGAIVEDGTHADLINAGGRYARLWAAQSFTPDLAAPVGLANR